MTSFNVAHLSFAVQEATMGVPELLRNYEALADTVLLPRRQRRRGLHQLAAGGDAAAAEVESISEGPRALRPLAQKQGQKRSGVSRQVKGAAVRAAKPSQASVPVVEAPLGPSAPSPAEPRSCGPGDSGGGGVESYLKALQEGSHVFPAWMVRYWGSHAKVAQLLRGSKVLRRRILGIDLVLFMAAEDALTEANVVQELQADAYDFQGHRCQGPSCVMVDIGGHIGAAAILFAKLNRGSRVYAFEPSRTTRFYFRWNMEMNCIRESGSLLKLAARALSRVGGATILLNYNGQDTPGTSAFVKPQGRGALARSEQARTITLSEALRAYAISSVSVLKLDCEGCEYDTVPSWSRALLARIAFCAGEVHPWIAPRFRRSVVAEVHSVMCSRRWKISHLKCPSVRQGPL